MNKEVSFEIAKLLKDKEFMDKNMYGEVRLSQPKFYDSDGIIHNIKDAFEKTELNLRKCYNAPTIAEVVMWLYEKHNIWIEASLNQFATPKNLEWMYSITFTQRCTYSYGHKSFNSPTEAYEAAITHTLEKLI